MDILLNTGLALLGAFALVEAGLNLRYYLKVKKSYWANKGCYQYDRKTGYRVRENLDLTREAPRKNDKSTGRIYYRTGRYGFKWLAGLESRRAILFLGDSFTESVNFPVEESFCGLLHKALEGQQPIVNGGLGGGRMVHFYQLLAKYGPKIDPALVFVQISHNDFYDRALGIEDVGNKFVHRMSYRMPTTQFQSIFSASLLIHYMFKRNKTKKYSADEKIATLHDYVSSDIWKNSIKEKCKQIMDISGSRKVFLYIPPSPFLPVDDEVDISSAKTEIGLHGNGTYHVFSEYYEQLNQLAQEMSHGGIEILNFNKMLDDLPIKERWSLFIDRSHLSQAGHHWFSNVLYNVVRTVNNTH